VYWLPVILWAGLIFSFSNQPYEKQELKSDLPNVINLQKVEKHFGEVQFEYSQKEVSLKSLGAAGFVEFFIRKGAHLSVYFVLGFLLYRALSSYKKRIVVNSGLSLLLTVLYAASDEFHQSITPNRTPLFHDVVIDTVGGIIGILVAILIFKKRSPS
jgi:VanZ family protein